MYDPGMAQDDLYQIWVLKPSGPHPAKTITPWKKFSCAPLSPQPLRITTAKSLASRYICQDPEDPRFGVPYQDVIDLQSGHDQVIGVEAKIFQSIARKHAIYHFLFYKKKSSKMQFSMILAKLTNLPLFSHFGFLTL